MSALINVFGLILIVFVVYWFWWSGKKPNKKK